MSEEILSLYDPAAARDLISVVDGDIDLGDELVEAVAMSLLSNAGQWWGDAVAEVPGDVLGSRLHELPRERRTLQTAELARQYASEALAWLVEDGVAERVDVAASLPERGMLQIDVTVVRGDQTTRLRVDDVWEALHA